MGQYSDLFEEGKPQAPNPGLAVQLTADAVPQQEVRYKDLASRYKVPVDVVRTFPKDYETKAKVDDIDTATAAAPHLRSWLADTRNTPLVDTKDVGILGMLEGALRYTVSAPGREGGLAGDVTTTLTKGAVVVPQAIVGLLDIPTFGYAGKGLEAIGVRFKDANTMLSGLQSPELQGANKAVQDAHGFFGKTEAALRNPAAIASIIGESLPLMGAGAIAGWGLRALAPNVAPWLAAAAGEGVVGAGSAAEGLREGNADGLLSVKQSFAAVMSGVGTAIFGAVGGKVSQKLGIADLDTMLVKGGMDAANAKAVKSSFLSSIAKAGLSEGVFEELPQSVQEQMWQNFATDKPIMEGALEAGALGMLAGAAGGVAAQVVEHHMTKAAGRINADQEAQRNATQSAQQLGQLMALAAQTQLREQSPGTFAELTQHLAEQTEGAPTEVRFDAQNLGEVLNQEEINLLPSVKAQLESGELLPGDEVSVPIGELMANVAGTPLEQKLMEHARVGDNELSAFEAKEAAAQAETYLQSEAKRVISEATDSTAHQASRDKVKQIMLDQFTSLNRWTADVNEANSIVAADMFTALAGRLGMTPEQAYQAYPLKITGVNPATQGVFDQITPEQAKATNVPVKMPTHELFSEAVANTKGAEITPDGLKLNLTRYQKPEQEGAQSVRTGVFYLPAGSSDARHYRNAKTGYGGGESFTGETLVRAPLFVKGATGGKAPEAAYIELKGKEAFKELNNDVMQPVLKGGYWGKTTADKVALIDEFLDKHAPELSGMGVEIERVSREGNTLRYALQEAAIAHAVREAGHDAVVGYSKGKAGAKISEVFDVREQTYPARGMDSQIHEVFNQAAHHGSRDSTKNDILKQAASAKIPQGDANDQLNQTAGSTGDRGGRADSRHLAPLEGAPSVKGFHGPDPRIVSVAERYARDHGIDLKRQAEYARVDPERAKRIADAYEVMPHAPQDPKVKEAYENLIRQTVDQYQYLADAGYKFWFIDLNNPKNAEYASTPWNAMRDMRANQEMGVFPTNEGFGSGAEFSPDANPLLADTGIKWPVGGPDGPLAPVLANDLFRAVHDAFGHGMEGAGFRAQGEENAWQAHDRLFTGSAKGAVASETRGQNSWVNYGPHGETNRTAKGEGTHFADQKTGLMPEWTWTEGRAGDQQDEVLKQEAPANKYQTRYPASLNADERAQYDVLATPQEDMFNGEFADEKSTVNTDVKISSKGDTLQGGNVNSAGQQITATKQGLQNFWKWFGASAAVDDDNKPIVLYHSTNGDFDTFQPGRETINSTTFGDVETQRHGIFLTPDIKFSEGYLRPGAGQNVMQVYASLQNPIDLREGISGEDLNAIVNAAEGKLTHRDFSYVDPYESWQFFDDEFGKNFVEAAKAAGYDGAIMFEAGPEDNKAATTYVAFDANQVKSATGNKGTFDPANPSILKQEARGTFNPGTLTISLLEKANLSTFHHEMAHFYLEVLADIASQPNAPESIKSDMDLFLKWAGVKDLATWNAMTLDEKRAGHEKFAEHYELYLFEGKAPSQELQPLFRRFASWMKNVYTSLKAFMLTHNSNLTPEVRGIYDRMLATEAQIEQAEAARKFQPLFASAEEAGMDPAAWAAYQLQAQEASESAIENLQARSLRDAKWMSNAHSRVIKAMQKAVKGKIKETTAEVTAEVEAMPVYAAKAALDELHKPTEADKDAAKDWRDRRAAAEERATEQVKADTLAAPEAADLKGLAKGQYLAKNKKVMANTVERLMIEWEKANPKPVRTNDPGDLQLTSERFGFSSPDEMLRAFAEAQPKAEVIEGMTDQRLLERYGDLTTEEGIKAAADEAIHNEARARFAATELRALSEGVRLKDTRRIKVLEQLKECIGS